MFWHGFEKSAAPGGENSGDRITQKKRAMHLRLWLFVATALVGVLFQPRDALAQHAWESEILAYEAQDRTSPPPLGSVVVTGSSTIQRWSTMRTDLAPLDVIPRGFGGSTTDDLDYYLERVVLVYQPRAVVIYEGDNDIANGRTAQYVADRIAGILARISARLPAARVYVLSIKPSPGRWFQWRHTIRGEPVARRHLCSRRSLHVHQCRTCDARQQRSTET